MIWCLHACREVLMTHLVQSSLETFKQKETFERAESRRVEETKVSNSLRQRCSNLEHKVQELERRNARLERKASEMEMENRKISQTAESYRIHYEGLRGKASMSPSLGGGSSTGGGGTAHSVEKLHKWHDAGSSTAQ